MNSAFLSLEQGQRRAGVSSDSFDTIDGDPIMPSRKGTGRAEGGRPSTRRLGCQRELSRF